MKYMLLSYGDEKVWEAMTPEQQAGAMAACEPHVKKLLAAGKIQGGAPLQPTTMATTVRVRGGKRLVTDGPFAETREQLGGYSIIEAANLDEAIAIASGFFGGSEYDELVSIEVRPIVDYEFPEPAAS